MQHQKQHHKPHRLQRIVDHNQESPHAAAHEGSHNGNQGHHGDQHPHHHRIGHTEDTHKDHKHGTQNHGFQTLSRDKIAEIPVQQTTDLLYFVPRPRRQVRGDQSSALAFQALLLCQNIQGKDEGNRPVYHAGYDAARHIEGGIEHISGAVFQKIYHIIQYALPIDLHGFQLADPVRQHRLIRRQLLKPEHHLFHEHRNLPAHLRRGHRHLWQHHPDHHGQYQYDQRNGKHHAKRPLPSPRGFIFPPSQKFFLDQLHRNIQHKGNAPAVDKRPQNPKHKSRSPHHLFTVNHGQRQNGGKQHQIPDLPYFFPAKLHILHSCSGYCGCFGHQPFRAFLLFYNYLLLFSIHLS